MHTHTHMPASSICTHSMQNIRELFSMFTHWEGNTIYLQSAGNFHPGVLS